MNKQQIYNASGLHYAGKKLEPAYFRQNLKKVIEI
jgi:hypothetical protein